MKIIVGLGNPGKDYQNTRHNVGFMALDKYLGEVIWKDKKNALIYETNLNDEKVLFVKPMTYMNESGKVIKSLVDFYKPDNYVLLVIYDDMDILLGEIKVKTISGNGGHNGIGSIIEIMMTKEIPRIKVGIGNGYEKRRTDFVLGSFSAKEKEKLDAALSNASKAIDIFVKYDLNMMLNNMNDGE